MKGRRPLLRFFGLWVLPPLVLLLVLLLAFAGWAISTTTGTRWLVTTAVTELGGTVQGVRGSILRGVSLHALELDLPDADVRLADLRLQVRWSALRQRRLQVRDLSAAALSLDLHPQPTEEEKPTAPFQMPVLPLDLQVDRLAIGNAQVRLRGEALPVADLALASSMALDRHGATVTLDELRGRSLGVAWQTQGHLALNALAAPWPFDLDLTASARGDAQDSPVCLRRVLAAKGPEGSGGTKAAQGAKGAKAVGTAEDVKVAKDTKVAKGGKAVSGAEDVKIAKDGKAVSGAEDVKDVEPACQIDATMRLAGTLSAIEARIQAQGEGMQLQGSAQVHPQQALPVGRVQLALHLPGDAALDLSLVPGETGADGLRPLDLRLRTQHLALTPWLPKGVGTSVLDLQARARAQLQADTRVQSASLALEFDPASRWNGELLAGAIKVGQFSRADGAALFNAQDPGQWDPRAVVLQGLDVALKLGADSVRAKGNLSARASQMDLQAALPRLSALWPQLPGGLDLKLQTRGSLARQEGQLQTTYTPEDPQPGVPGRAPITLQLASAGGWTDSAGWQGGFSEVRIRHAGAEIHNVGSIPLALDPAGAWTLGSATLDVSLDGRSLFQVHNLASKGAPGQWHSRGRIDPLRISAARIERIQRWLGLQDAAHSDIHVEDQAQARRQALDMRLDWDLNFQDALTGDVRLARTAGDLTVPGDVPVPLQLQAAQLDVALRRVAGRAGVSQARADLQVTTKRLGRLRVQADTPVHALPGGGLTLSPQDESHVRVRAESEDLGWLNLLLDGAVEVGGTVHADIEARGRGTGAWTVTGPIRGENLTVLMVDQGVRLLNGTLQAHFAGTRMVLDHLRFPAERRVTPKEWRTATWIAEDPDAQKGYLDLSGQWDLQGDSGEVTITPHRYPILQRADRYAMISGKLRIEAGLPKVRVSGKVTADAGWFDLDMLSNIPSLDGDVVVLKPGEKAARPTPPDAAPTDVQADVTIDLGPRFYITGYGLDSGLTGSLDLHLQDGKLTALGALRTRGGAINAYGQHLQLRRGTITFQGDIANPVLDIQALRTDVQVQAGVRVAGTARHPLIDLVSYPDVSETEKLTWLLLGHGPDEGSGADMSLLFSVGSSFLSGGEPFYKRFGLDELSMRSGELGSTGSILPAQTVVSGLDAGASTIEQKFVLAGKTLTRDLRASLEQALAQTGTVGRLSYRLTRGLRAEMTVGTVNGLALIYRWFSMD